VPRLSFTPIDTATSVVPFVSVPPFLPVSSIAIVAPVFWIFCSSSRLTISSSSDVSESLHCSANSLSNSSFRSPSLNICAMSFPPEPPFMINLFTRIVNALPHTPVKKCRGGSGYCLMSFPTMNLLPKCSVFMKVPYLAMPIS